MKKMNELYKKMTVYYKEDPKRIQHFVKVHSFAKLIGEEEGLDEKTLEILEAAALVHDIGIKPAMEQFGKCDGRLQEKLGPARAEDILKEVGFSQEVVHRVSFLVGHHHTYTNIDGMDYQILVEADFLVNFYEDEMKTETIRTTVEKVFRSKTGREIAENMFFPKPFQKSETWAQDALQDLEDFNEEQGIYIRQ